MPLLFAAVVVSVVTLKLQHAVGSISTDLTWGERLASAIVAYTAYSLKLLWPQNLAVIYPHPGQWPLPIILCAVTFMLAVTSLVILKRARPYSFMGWLWFLIGMLPMIGIVQVGTQFMADRYTYVSYIGLFLMLAWSAADLVARWPDAKWPVCALLTIALAGSAFGASRQLKFWTDSGTLFARAIEVTRGNYVAYNNLGHYYFSTEESERAMDCFSQALTFKPNYPDALNNLGVALMEQGKLEAARSCFEMALKADPSLRVAYANLKEVKARLDRPAAVER